jgi:hypothetical protein
LVIDCGFSIGTRGPRPSFNLRKPEQHDPFTPAAFQFDPLRDEPREQVAAFATALLGGGDLVKMADHAIPFPTEPERLCLPGKFFETILEMRFVLKY